MAVALVAADPYRKKYVARSSSRPRTSPKKEVSLPFLQNTNEQVCLLFFSPFASSPFLLNELQSTCDLRFVDLTLPATLKLNPNSHRLQRSLVFHFLRHVNLYDKSA